MWSVRVKISDFPFSESIGNLLGDKHMDEYLDLFNASDI